MKMKKLVSALVLTLVLASVTAVPVMAATPPFSYGWEMPAEFKGSMRSTALQLKTSASTTPYVNSELNTLQTSYFLSPKPLSSIDATDVKTFSTPGRRNFTWRTGYGGTQQSYCLSVYPDMSGSWAKYTVKGTWGH